MLWRRQPLTRQGPLASSGRRNRARAVTGHEPGAATPLTVRQVTPLNSHLVYYLYADPQLSVRLRKVMQRVRSTWKFGASYPSTVQRSLKRTGRLGPRLSALWLLEPGSARSVVRVPCVPPSLLRRPGCRS